jgi:transcriptional regulator with XRE-family HTH domain
VAQYRTGKLAVVIGGNCCEIRRKAGLTRNDLAKFARSVGLRWTASKVSDFENGRSAPTFATVLAVSLALSNATRRDVTLTDLVKFGDGEIELNDQLSPHGWRLEQVARGEPWGRLDEDEQFVATLTEVFSQIERRSGLDEQRLAKRLGIDVNRLGVESLRLWGRTFSDERDHRAGSDANQQKKGRISRELRAELEKALTSGGNNQ